jgi:hypothetical protein
LTGPNPNDNLQALLQQGIEKARAGDRAGARELFERVVERDENNEKGWFWLASVVDTDEERRICLANVLHINPNNERARQAMNALEAKKKAVQEQEEVLPGVSRRTLTLLIGGAALVVIVVIALAVVIVTNNNRQAQEIAAQQTAQQIAFAETGTAFVIQGTGTAVAATETRMAIATDTPLPTNTPNIPTLPPTWTPVPTATPPPTAEILPPPVGLSGYLAAFRGRDVLATGDLAIGVFDLASNLAWQPIAGETGQYPSIFVNGTRIAYSFFNPIDYNTAIAAVNFNGSDPERFADRWLSAGVPVFDAQYPRYSDDGLSMVVIGRPRDMQTDQVFISSLAQLPPGQPPPPGYIRQLTNDPNARFSFASLSPDGTQIVAVREIINAQPAGPDIVLIDAQGRGIIPVTNDYSTTIETQPQWSPDGSQIVYAAALANEGNNYDLYVISARGSGSPSPIYRSPASDRYPVVSPDGRHIAFASDRGGFWDIYIYELATQTLYQLTNGPDLDYPSDWWMRP